jgi:glutathionylspermidine synthase
MRRLATVPRPDWREHVERDLGFHFHTINDAPYWDETACYAFSAAEVDELEAASGELEQMALELVSRVGREGEAAYRRLRIPESAWAAVERSWREGEKNLYGRFDLRYDGTSPPKLLEYNADTPTALYEAAVVQWDWLESQWPGRDQFNSLHERLIAAWRGFGLGGATVHFTAVRDHAEDVGTVAYLQDTAVQAGLATATIGFGRLRAKLASAVN